MEVLRITNTPPTTPAITHVDVRLSYNEAMFLGRVVNMLPRKVAVEMAPDAFDYAAGMSSALRVALNVRTFHTDPNDYMMLGITKPSNIDADGRVKDVRPALITVNGEDYTVVEAAARIERQAETIGRQAEEIRSMRETIRNQAKEIARLQDTARNPTITVNGVTFTLAEAAQEIRNMRERLADINRLSTLR